MTFFCERRKVNLIDEKSAHELEILLNKCYHRQKEAVDKHESTTYYKLEIKEYLTKNKMDKIRKKLSNFGNDAIFSMDNNYELIYDYSLVKYF